MHKIVSSEEWHAARKSFLAKEKGPDPSVTRSDFEQSSRRGG
jgi:hypothetical protein